MNEIMKDKTSLLNNVMWYDINKKGYINKSLKYQAAVYIYKKTSSFDGKACYYVGSSIKLASRISSHRCRVTNWHKYENTDFSFFYRSILKHGWLNFKFGVLEYVDLYNIMDIKQKKKTLLEREQYYLDNINPSLNIRKIASSPLGIKRDITFNTNKSESQINKKLNIKVNDINNISKNVRY
jgi:group I intron endonuclease